MGCTKVRQKRQIFYISMTLFCTLSSVLAEEVCCTKSAWAYPTGEAVPPECDKNGVTCTEGLIHVEKPLKSSKSIAGLLGRVKKSGPITILDNTDLVISIDMLEEIVHNGPGPAVHLRDPKLADGTCFTSLKRIIVDEPLRYCKKRDLLLFEGNVTPEVKDLLEKAANETLSGCESLTTPIPTSATLNWTTTIRSLPTTSNGIAVVPPLCVQSSAAASAHEKLKCPSKNGILAAGIIVIVILLVLLGISMSVSIKLYFFRKQEDAAFAAFVSYVTQVINSMIYLQSGCDSAMLNGFMLDGLHKKSAQLAKLADKYHDQAAVRKTKFKEGQPLDPTTDLFRKATVHWKQNFELYDKPHLEKEFIEAAQKYEAVKKAHEAGKEFEPPKGTRIWSDVRLKCPEKMELAKLPEQQIVARKPKPQLPKGPPKAFSKRRQKGGGDPLSKAASSVANTENPKMENRKKENPKVAESKVGEPKMGNLKKEEQKKGEPKKEEVKQGDEQVKYVEPEAIVKRELKKDQPKKVFVMPRESIQLEKCHPLCLTSRVPSIYDTFKSKSTVLRDTFSVFSLVMEELDNYYEFHARALALINLNANHVEIKMVETARYGAQYDKVNSTWPAFPLNKQPKNRWAVNGRPHYQIPLAYDELKRLRAGAKANEKRLLEMLEAEHVEMANLLHAEGLNYFFWYKTNIHIEQAILPGETVGDACKRVFRSHDRYKELFSQLNEVHYARNPGEKPKKYQKLQNPPAPKTSEDNNAKEKDSKDENPKKA